MKVTRRGTVTYDGEQLKLSGWAVRFGRGEDYPGHVEDIRTERGAKAAAAILIHMAARYGVELEEVERDHALCEPLFAEKVMRQALERVKPRRATWRERCGEQVRRAGRFLSIMVWGC